MYLDSSILTIPLVGTVVTEYPTTTSTMVLGVAVPENFLTFRVGTLPGHTLGNPTQLVFLVQLQHFL